MSLMKIRWRLLLWVLLCGGLDTILSQPFDYPTANLSTSWVNSVSAPHSVNFSDGSIVRAVLLRGTFGPKYACGFFCNGTQCHNLSSNSYLFAIFIVQTDSASYITSPSIGFPQVVWSANRDRPVRINATLQLTSAGDLLLKDADGSIAWSANTSGRSVVGLNLTEEGNLLLFDTNNSTVWQSFDHPTDSLVPAQRLFVGQKLTASVSATNWSQGALFSLAVTNEGLVAFIESQPPQIYYNYQVTGYCYLPSEIFSLMNNEKEKTHYNSSAYIKVQASSSLGSPGTDSSSSGKSKSKASIILGSTGGALFLLLLITSFAIVVYRKKKRAHEVEEDYLDQVPGMPTRFSHEQLKDATDNFSKKLGEGGFGSVFEGTLNGSLKVAVKCLDGVGHAKKSFLAEVETIGSIHHVNLVRLIGFCAEKAHRLLVYQFMSNGSLDKWIYHRNQEHCLEWRCRKKIVHDIAKGLAYLHEDCRQKIIHLDIKPQNILLDDNLNAKVSDFGLSKLIDRDKSQVMTTMRGTPGYLAPEWLSSVITEKVDVYSFGVVVLELMCGRRNIDMSQPEEGMHLLSLFKQKAEEGRLLDMVDKYNEDLQLHAAEVVEMMEVAAWCLQSDYTKRPAMSTVVKVIEGVMECERNLDYNFWNPSTWLKADHHLVNPATPLLPSLLSGPR
ncbi:Non-specific serine/threonine protein kinase [Bertholletia excelsa]